MAGPDREWERAREVFHRVVDVEPEARTGLLDRLCAGEAAVRREVESLLEAHDRAEGFIDSPAAETVPSGGAQADALEGRSVGAYRLVRRIGVGGMGVVFLAERSDGEFEHRVAIKVLRPELATEDLERRFGRERRALAALQHPNIARFIDSGRTDEGLPYLVLEYLQGEPVTVYCDSRRLPVEDRLRLFLTVCDAVSAAHRGLVVHRDLKPSNILVSADGTVKLLDFGIARLLDGSDREPVTIDGRAPMTPAYASPEQLEGRAVDTTSDVYSLGVVLFELLSGHLPRLQPPGVDLGWRDAVAAPSVAVRRAGDRGTKARDRGTSASRLSRRLGGDLDRIVGCALRAEPEHRYRSVDALAADVRRHLEGAPVAARGDSVVYRSVRLLRRYRVAFAAVVLVVLSMVGGTVETLRQASRARRQRAVAEGRRDDVRTLARTFVFEVYDAVREVPGSDSARRRIVESALDYAESLAREAKGDPDLLHEVASIYRRLGQVQGSSGGLDDSAGAAASSLRAVELGLQCAEAWWGGMRVSEAIAALEWAEEASEEALRESPGDREIICVRARVLARQADATRAAVGEQRGSDLDRVASLYRHSLEEWSRAHALRPLGPVEQSLRAAARQALAEVQGGARGELPRAPEDTRLSVSGEPSSGRR